MASCWRSSSTACSIRWSATRPITSTRAGAGGTRSCTPRRFPSPPRTGSCGTRPPPHARSAVHLLRRVSVMLRVFISVLRDPERCARSGATDQYDERTTILSYATLRWWGGLIMSRFSRTRSSFSRMPRIPRGAQPGGDHRYGIVASAVMLTAFSCRRSARSDIPYLKQPPATRAVGLVGALRELR